MTTDGIPIPDRLLISPISLTCPRCGATPNHDCETGPDGLAVVHLERIKAAALIDIANKLDTANKQKPAP